MSERFIIRDDPDNDSLYDTRMQVYDTKRGVVVGCDGGEPEDQTLGRDWNWVMTALNNLDEEKNAQTN